MPVSEAKSIEGAADVPAAKETPPDGVTYWVLVPLMRLRSCVTLEALAKTDWRFACDRAAVELFTCRKLVGSIPWRESALSAYGTETALMVCVTVCAPFPSLKVRLRWRVSPEEGV